MINKYRAHYSYSGDEPLERINIDKDEYLYEVDDFNEMEKMIKEHAIDVGKANGAKTATIMLDGLIDGEYMPLAYYIIHNIGLVESVQVISTTNYPTKIEVKPQSYDVKLFCDYSTEYDHLIDTYTKIKENEEVFPNGEYSIENISDLSTFEKKLEQEATYLTIRTLPGKPRYYPLMFINAFVYYEGKLAFVYRVEMGKDILLFQYSKEDIESMIMRKNKGK